MDRHNLYDVNVAPQPQAAEEILAYWTEERIRSAIPMTLPVLPPSAKPELGKEAVGAPVQASSRGPDAGEPQSMSECFQTSLVNNLNVFPYCAAGKLYMTFGNLNYQGSAWVVGEKTICTAGHCVYEPGGSGWAKNVAFFGRFNNGAYIGRWGFSVLAAPHGWTDSKDFAYDIGFAISPTPIRPTMGKLGWMANYPPNQGPYTEIGYPAQPLPGYPFDGQRMWQSVGAYVDGTTIIQACGNMTGGCSGGPWAVFKQNDWRGNGVNSHRYTDPNRIYSPYFGQQFINLIDWMKKNGGD